MFLVHVENHFAVALLNNFTQFNHSIAQLCQIFLVSCFTLWQSYRLADIYRKNIWNTLHILLLKALPLWHSIFCYKNLFFSKKGSNCMVWWSKKMTQVPIYSLVNIFHVCHSYITSYCLSHYVTLKISMILYQKLWKS